ncbi:DUF4158 domain-containing protein [Nocardiopsis sp. CC223A]|uniref:DUF4158 domain-containing protein n=1 Tax=Nocardiopsis sp. CC223A TaxID=3044051 RepID=UPI00278BC6ED|nr:DUF4158 domain-containing protein [Nocardiopsis sp. CC223A]
MRTQWTVEELEDQWKLDGEDRKLVGNKTGATRLWFALLLKFFQIEGRIPTCAEEIPALAVDYVADQVNIDPGLFAKYSWTNRTIEHHRKQIRDTYGSRPASEDDEEHLAAALVRRCRTLSIEPTRPGQIERVVASGVRRFEAAFTARVLQRLGAAVCDRLEREVLQAPGVLGALKAAPGAAGAGDAAGRGRQAHHRQGAGAAG